MRKIILIPLLLLSLFIALPVFPSVASTRQDSRRCFRLIPIISKITPQPTYPGQTVNIYGSAFQTGGLAVFYLNSRGRWTRLQVNLISSSWLSFTAPFDDAPESALYVRTCGGDSLPHPFSVAYVN